MICPGTTLGFARWQAERSEAQWRKLLADGGFRAEQVESGLIRAVACP